MHRAFLTLSLSTTCSAVGLLQHRCFSTMERKLPKIAVGQMCATFDIEGNYAQCAALAKSAKEQGASLLSLPECFDFIGVPGTGDSILSAQPLSGPLFTRYRNLAKETGLWLSLGGFHESSDDPKKIYNTHAIVSSEGEIVASYNKIHLFDVDVDGGFQESKSTHFGDYALVVKDTPVGNIGVTTCFDLRFPELFTALREAGADIMLVPSAFMPTTGKAHWHVLLRARAIETQCYVVAAAQFGRHNPKRASFGHSLIVDPWGEVLQDLGAEGNGVGVAAIDSERMESVRKAMPIVRHRRRDIFDFKVKDGKLRVVTPAAQSSL